MTVGELREKLAEFKDDAEVVMLFDTPYRTESHYIEHVTTTPRDEYVRENSKNTVYLEWRCG